MNRTAAALLLLVATFFWGMTFAVVKGAIAGVGVYVFLSQRFVAAFLVLAAVAGRGGLPDRGTLARGLALGAVLFPVYAFQTVGLRFTSASNSAFISGLGVVLVPVLAAPLLRERTGGGLWAAVGLAVAGLLLLTTGGRWEGTLNRGDLLSAVCALFIALHLVLAARFAPRGHVAWLAALQIGVVAVGSLAAAAIRGERALDWHPGLLWPLVFCALLGTVFAFLALMAAQRVLSPTHTAVIVCMEPVFAAVWAWLATGERLTTAGYVGAGLILAAMLLAEVVANRCRVLGRGCRV